MPQSVSPSIGPFLLLFFLFSALMLSSACRSPEAESTVLTEEMASIAESNKDNCTAMGTELQEFVDDNKESLEESFLQSAKNKFHRLKVCGKEGKSGECLELQEEYWKRGDIKIKGDFAMEKLKYYTKSWCANNKKVGKAQTSFRKIMQKAEESALKDISTGK